MSLSEVEKAFALLSVSECLLEAEEGQRHLEDGEGQPSILLQNESLPHGQVSNGATF